jgi:hypothetical protein
MSGPNIVAPVVASAAKQSSYPRDSPSMRWQARTKRRAGGPGTVDCVAALAMTVVVA